tara:strand:- start:609 stop:1298 length:690 start_codon:yes stop_codon:yes gene_type:complete
LQKNNYFIPWDDTVDNHDCWNIYPEHRWIHNKLELSLKCGHNAGPIPLLPKKSGYYILRPIYNLIGWGLNAKKIYIDINDKQSLFDCHPGEFWCEWFEGPHYSIDYEWDKKWKPIFATEGFNSAENFIKFTRWNKIDIPDIPLPKFLDRLKDIKYLNIEFKDSKIIEVHLRLGNLLGDWHGLEHAKVIVPAWKSKYMEEALLREQQGWHFVYDADLSNLPDPRLGFWYI